MRALVISGGGSKGAFAGGVAQYLMQEMNYEYDLFLGTSTGSLLISHLALGKIEKNQTDIHLGQSKKYFSICPFTIEKKHGVHTIGINHWNVLKSFYRGNKTFARVSTF